MSTKASLGEAIALEHHELAAQSIEDKQKANQNDLNHLLAPEDQKKLIRRIDLRLLPILGLMYSISLIDRTNLGLALVAGLQEELRLDIGTRYTIIVMIFFVSYVISSYPKAGPQNWLAFLGIGFGAVLIGLGFCQSWISMAVCRLLLGVMESGFLPGCTYLITCWYTRFEVGKRLSAFWILSVVASGFAAIFAYVLSLLDGQAGLRGWRWIFIIEGAITCVVCIIGWFLVIDFPTKSGNFLSPSETEFVVARLNRDRGDAIQDEFTVRKILNHLKDWRLYIWAINLLASTLPGYAYSYFLPIILRDGMGFSRTQSQLLSAPPYIFAAIITYISGWIGDKYKIRGPLIAAHQLITAIGMLITAFGQSNGARYFGSFLVIVVGIGFVQFCVPGVLTFQANNITQHSKRAVASATCILGGGIGGIIAGVAFKAEQSPKYTIGVFTTIGISVLSICLIIGMDLFLWRCNKAVRAGRRRNENVEDWLYTI